MPRTLELRTVGAATLDDVRGFVAAATDMGLDARSTIDVINWDDHGTITLTEPNPDCNGAGYETEDDE